MAMTRHDLEQYGIDSTVEYELGKELDWYAKRGKRRTPEQAKRIAKSLRNEAEEILGRR